MQVTFTNFSGAEENHTPELIATQRAGSMIANLISIIGVITTIVT